MTGFSQFLTPVKKAIAINTTAQLVGRAIGALTMTAVTIMIAGRLGASGYGDYVKVTTYAAFFYLIADFGINAVFLHQDEKQQFPSLVALRIIMGALLIGVALVILSFLPGSATQGYSPSVRLGILLFAPTILFQAMITTANAVFQRHLRYDKAAWAIFFGSIATLALLWLFMYQLKTTSLLAILGAVAAGSFLTAVFSYIFANNFVKLSSFTPSLVAMKQLFVPSIPLGITLVFNLVYFRADSVVITLTRPTAEVGIYGLAYKVFELLLVFPTFFMNAVYPLMLRGKQLKKLFLSSFFFLFGSSLLVMLGVWFAAPLLTIIKSDFYASIPALRILSFGIPLFFVTAATMWTLIAQKKQKILAYIYGLSMVGNIVGNILFVPTHGYIAAAWVTVGSEAVVLLLSLFVLNKDL